MVYTNGLHLIADTLDELYSYASSIGLNPDWINFMGRNIHPHFRIFGKVKDKVLEDAMVKKVTSREIVAICKLNYRIPDDDNEVEEWHDKRMEAKPDMELPSETDYERMINNIFKRSGINRS